MSIGYVVGLVSHVRGGKDLLRCIFITSYFALLRRKGCNGEVSSVWEYIYVCMSRRVFAY